MTKEKQLKMIWDFRGPNASEIAKHHEIHLNDYFRMESKAHFGTGVEILSGMHTIAYVIIPEPDMRIIRDALKPHRAQWHNA